MWATLQWKPRNHGFNSFVAIHRWLTDNILWQLAERCIEKVDLQKPDNFQLYYFSVVQKQ